MHSDLKALEFGAIQRLLERLTSTPYGAEAARNVEPAPDIVIASRMQAAVSAARRLIEAGAVPALSRVPDIRAALRQANQTGAALQGTALHNIRLVMQTVAGLQSAVAVQPALYPGESAHLQPPVDLAAYIDKTVQANGHLRPDASEQLARLHAQLKQLRGEVAQALKKRIREPDLKGVIDDEKIVWQGNRGMLALSPGHADKIKGVRRGTGSNGRDLIIEPMEIIALNNRIETVSGQQDAEQQVIRRAVTDAVRTAMPALEQMLDALTWIDLALAGGHLSVHLNAAEPRLVDQPIVHLDRAYHPAMLLQFAEGSGPQPVPLSIRLDAQQPMLVITGPNTGGKTVVLKTIGLLTTMAHCGLHVPSEGECVIGNFKRVIVDIGDQQSLYHHLSTFAGHVEVLKRLLNEADHGTLVLLDELGTGTDPEEGAALAMAVLDELVKRDVRGIVTTHLSPLKGFAEQHPRLTNASMHFDSDALQPTYELDIGVSGRSLGLIIASKNGLPPELVKEARRHLHNINPLHDTADAS